MIKTYAFFVFILITPFSFVHAQSSQILGTTTAEELRSTHRIFDIYTNRFQPDSASVQFFNDLKVPIDIKILFGTWCHDSKREIPAFIKTMEMVENELITYELIGVSRKKSEPENRNELYDLQYTPTFIIFLAEKEIGRMVEESTESIEKDLVEIIKTGINQD
ncbi:MAG: thioredoxin family protein [Balneolaceae bacterium]|nr:thioredoxin family protein [Balneolaceae bacterium]